MLSLLKKKSEAGALALAPAWHPNFRNYEKLPDIKVVRTAFFVNGLAIFVLLALLTFFGYKEWQLRGLRSQVAEWQQRIDKHKKASDQGVATFKKFQAEEAKILEVDTFLKSRITLSDLLIRLGSTLPANIALDAVELRETGLSLRLSVRGEAAEASGYATAYLEQLRADKELVDFDEFQFASQPVRNPATNRIAVEFFLHLKNQPAKK